MPASRLLQTGRALRGTGNYSLALKQDGREALVLDREPAMLARAADKGLETIEADAMTLPLEDSSVDAAMALAGGLREGLARLAEMVTAGSAPSRPGRGSVFAWRKPEGPSAAPS